MNFLLDYLRPNDVFVDVGANVGVYALLGSTVPGVEVWAFEPSSETVTRLRMNVDLNGVGDIIHVVQAAVGAGSGSALLTVGLASVNHLIASKEPTVSAETIPMVSLDERFIGAETALSILKIDVEGHEIAVLEGAKRVIEASRPPVIVEANDVAGLAAWLSILGYRPYTYSADDKELREADWGPMPSGNILAVADSQLASRRLGAAVVPAPHL